MKQSDKPGMMSDGRRMRVIWQDGDGDGDSCPNVLARSLSTTKGHPTWKIFAGHVPEEFVRGENEPPHYVYLDDRACYAVFRNKDLYSNEELRMFWPFDFDHQQGFIKKGRQNRGRPAYQDNTCQAYAQGPLRGRNKPIYEFTGQPNYSEYQQKAKPSQFSKTEEMIAQEYDERVERTATPDQISPGLSSRAITDPPCRDVPVAPSKHNPRPVLSDNARRASLDPTTGKRQFSKAFTPSGQRAQTSSNRKSFNLPMDISSDNGTFSPALPGVQPNRRAAISPSASNTSTSKIGRNTNYGSVTPDTETGRLIKKLRSQDPGAGGSESELMQLRRENELLKLTNSNTKSELRKAHQETQLLNANAQHLESYNKHYQRVVVMLLKHNTSKKHGFKDRANALQALHDSLTSRTENRKAIKQQAEQEVAQTKKLLRALDTMLEETREYMYSVGMDEEYEELQRAAREESNEILDSSSLPGPYVDE